MRKVKPICDIRLLDWLVIKPAVTRRWLLPLDPIAAALERVGWERQAMAHFMSIESPPINLRARQPQSAQRLYQKLFIGTPFVRMSLRIDHELSGFAGERPDHRAQGLARSDFQHRRIRVSQQCARPVCEAHGLAQVARPVTGIGRVVGAYPCSAHVGQVSNLWSIELHFSNVLGEFRDDRRHRPRVKCMRRKQAPAVYVLRREALLQVTYGLMRAR